MEKKIMEFKEAGADELVLVKGIDGEFIAIPDEVEGKKVTIIGEKAFAGLTGIRKVELGRNIREIGEGAFEGCSSMTTYSLPGDSDVFLVVDGALYTQDRKLVSWPAGKTDEVAVVMEGAVEILEGAFTANPYVRTICLPRSLKNVEARFTQGCVNLSEYICHGYGGVSVSEGMLYTNNQRCLVSCPPGLKSKRIFIMPSRDMLDIAPHAFEGCRNIERIELGGDMHSIGEGAFDNMASLEEVRIAPWYPAEAVIPLELLDKDGRKLGDAEIGGKVFTKTQKGFVHTSDYAPEYKEERSLRSRREMAKPPLFVPAKVENVTFEDIAGLTDVKEEIRERLILPMKHPDIYRKFGAKAGGGVIMHGPPGTGKTMLAQATASELGIPLYSIKCSDLMSKWVGETEARIKELFETARSNPAAVIFFDDFDAIGVARGATPHPFISAMITELLTQIQGLEQHESTLLIMAATNRIEHIDEALLRSGRFDTHIHVPLPDREAREFILRKHIEPYPCGNLDFGSLAEMTGGCNAADVVEICMRAKKMAIKRNIAGEGEQNITMEDMMKAVKSVGSTAPVDEGRHCGCSDYREEPYSPSDNCDLAGYY